MVFGRLFRGASGACAATAGAPTLLPTPPVASADAPEVAAVKPQRQQEEEPDAKEMQGSPADARLSTPQEVGEELDWELVEAESGAPSVEPLAFEDYLVVESAVGEASPAADDGDASEAGMATPRQSTSEDDEQVEFRVAAGSEKPHECETPQEPPTREPSEKVVRAGRDDASDGSSSVAEEVEPIYSCLACHQPVFKACEIISSNYHAQTSPGYLLSAVRNVSISSETSSAQYTTGRYEIQEVSCNACAAVLGVTYSGASEARNQYKVGKFLVGCDRLLLPPGVVHPMDKKD